MPAVIIQILFLNIFNSLVIIYYLRQTVFPAFRLKIKFIWTFVSQNESKQEAEVISNEHAKPNGFIDLSSAIWRWFIYLCTHLLAPNFRRKRRRLRFNPYRSSGFRLSLKSV